MGLFGVDGGRLAPGGLVAQLLQRRPGRQVQQIVLTPGIGVRRLGDRRLLLRGQPAFARCGVGLGVGPQPLGGLELVLGLGHRLAEAPPQHVGRRAVPTHTPQVGLGHPRRSQRLERGADVLHARGALHHSFGLARGHQRRIEVAGENRQRLLQFPELRAHGHRLNGRTALRGKCDLQRCKTTKGV